MKMFKLEDVAPWRDTGILLCATLCPPRLRGKKTTAFNLRSSVAHKNIYAKHNIFVFIRVISGKLKNHIPVSL